MIGCATFASSHSPQPIHSQLSSSPGPPLAILHGQWAIAPCLDPFAQIPFDPGLWLCMGQITASRPDGRQKQWCCRGRWLVSYGAGRGMSRGGSKWEASLYLQMCDCVCGVPPLQPHVLNREDWKRALTHTCMCVLMALPPCSPMPST